MRTFFLFMFCCVVSVVLGFSLARAEDSVPSAMVVWEDMIRDTLLEREHDAARIRFTWDAHGAEEARQHLASVVDWEIESLNFSPSSPRIEARFHNVHAPQQRMMLTGRAEIWVKVPTLKASLPAKTVLTEAHLDEQEVLLTRLRADSVREKNALIGKMLARSISAGKPLRSNDVAKPVLVSKNHLVDVMYSTPYMQIKTEAIALDAGGEGDVIRVKNTSTNKILRAQVEGETLVRVSASAL